MKIVKDKEAWAMIKEGRKYLSVEKYAHWTNKADATRWVDSKCAWATWNRLLSTKSELSRH